MKPTTTLIPIRSTVFVGCPSKLQPLLLSRCYATHKGVGATPQGPKRRAVTPFNDTGYVPWSQLSVAEKAGRATQQTVNFGMILIGLVLTVSHLSRQGMRQVAKHLVGWRDILHVDRSLFPR